MLFHVCMDVRLPADMPADAVNEIEVREKAYPRDLQRSGKWRHIRCLISKYASVSVFDVQSSVELHDILAALSLFPYMEISVTLLYRHPSSVHSDDT